MCDSLAPIEDMWYCDWEGERCCESLGVSEVGVHISSGFLEGLEMLLGGGSVVGVKGGNSSVWVGHQLGGSRGKQARGHNLANEKKVIPVF